LDGIDAAQQQLAAYHNLVRKYHRTLDLVSDRALDRFPAMVEQAWAYANTIERVAQPGGVVDVGSGVGLPGVVVAVALPYRPVLLVERRRRRATFLRMVVSQLGLANAVVSEGDVRNASRSAVPRLDPPIGTSPEVGMDGFAVVTAQAVAALADVYCLTRHLHADVVTVVARKGPSWRAEVRAVEERIAAAADVRAEMRLQGSGTLVAIDVPGGLPCPPSG
jgi:16S rRNA (guanine527-N7)-methyltransferase